MALTAGLSILCCPETASAGPFDRFAGSFSATGTVTEGPNADTHPVRCSFLASQQGPTGLALRGTCSAYLIVSRSISADLALDPRSGKVSGTYTGARVGTARLSGRQQGAGISLTVNWPAPLFGNMTSDMRIASSDPGRVRIVVLSRIGVNGPVRATTDLVLTRQ